MTGRPETFAAYAEAEPGACFSDWLQAGAAADWQAAVTHRFTVELAGDDIDDAVFRRYLLQDYAFVETLAGVVGFAVGHAPAMAEKKVMSGFLGVLTGDENDYFERSFAALDTPIPARDDIDLAPATHAFCDLMLTAAQEDYAEILGVLLPAEWIYLTWATAHKDRTPSRFYLKEWIDLHAVAEFEAFVAWLRMQADIHGPALVPKRQKRVDELFQRMTALEVAFFDAAYG